MTQIVPTMFFLCKFFFLAIPEFPSSFRRCQSACGWRRLSRSCC